MAGQRQWAGMLVLGLAAFLAGCWGADPQEEISVDPSKRPPELPEVEPTDSDWPWWRGPNRDNLSPATDVPTTWDEDQNVVWKSPVPGRGHASPTIWGDRIFLATADESAGTQSVLCYQIDDGEKLWETAVHKGSLDSAGHHEGTHANPTVATDGERVFATFLNGGAVWLTALDFSGEPVWQTEVGRFTVSRGYNPSPAIYKSFVIIAADHEKGGYLAAVHRKTGDIVWRKNRPAEASYASPLIKNIGGRDQILIAGADIVAGYDPENGEKLWSVSGTTSSVASTMTTWGDYAVASGGYPGSETICLHLAEATEPEVAWKTRKKSYVPSLLIHEGTLYQVHGEDGVMSCLDVETGERNWRGRISGSKIRSSPVYADGHVFVVNDAGKCFVIEASPESFQIVAENQLGDEAYATPTIVDGRIYLRVAEGHGDDRREFLYCLGKK